MFDVEIGLVSRTISIVPMRSGTPEEDRSTMKLFRRTERRPDPLRGDRRAHQLREQLEQGNWRAVHEALEGVDHAEQEFLIGALSEIPGRPDWIDAWVEACPDSALAWTFRGSHGVHWAWEARTGARANDVARDAWPKFFDRLERADYDLARATQLDPSSHVPWTLSMPIARGRELGPDELWKRFEQVVSRDPWNWYAHGQMVQSLCPKWSGSEAELMEFVSTIVERAPVGDPVHAQACSAVIEMFVELDAASYLTRSDVRSLVERAAAKSVGAREFESTRDGNAARNLFAATFWIMDRPTEAMAQLDAIGDDVTEWPWMYWSDQAPAHVDKLRRALGRRAA